MIPALTGQVGVITKMIPVMTGQMNVTTNDIPVMAEPVRQRDQQNSGSAGGLSGPRTPRRAAQRGAGPGRPTTGTES
jgi:hypothetical protein